MDKGTEVLKRVRPRAGGFSQEALLAARKDIITNPVSGLYSRYQFERMLQKFRAEFKRGINFGIIYLDIDNFKRINDEKGHLAGDRILARVGRIIKESIRGGDWAFNPGGDEFVIVYVLSDKENTGDVITGRIKNGGADISISAGVARTTEADDNGKKLSFDEALKIADLRMLEKKAQKK